MIVQFGGLLVAIFSVSQLQVYVSATSAPTSIESALLYTLYILASAAVIIIIFRFYKGRLAFVLLESFVVLFATAFLLWLIISTAFPSFGFYHAAAVAVAVTAILIIAKNKRPRLRNFIAVTSSMGVGIIIGFNGFVLAYALMLFIAIYDYIAVFVTKHMITMAKEISSRNLAFLIGSNDVEAIPKSYLSKADIAQFRKETKDQKVKDPMLKRMISNGVIPMVSQVQLGTGDLAIPLMLAVSAYISFLNYFLPIMVIAGATCGIVFTMYLLKRYKVALPAIPPLFGFINLFLAAGFIATGTGSYQIWAGFIIMFVLMTLTMLSKLKSPK